jgi:hypothetical protein
MRLNKIKYQNKINDYNNFKIRIIYHNIEVTIRYIFSILKQI